MIVSLVYGLIAICFSLAIPYEDFFFYIKNVIWMFGWVLIGALTTTSTPAGILGGLLCVLVFVKKTEYPLIFVTLFVGALGAILLGGAI